MLSKVLVAYVKARTYVTKVRILIISHATSSSRILTACGCRHQDWPTKYHITSTRGTMLAHLLRRDASRKEFDQITGVENGCRVICFTCRLYRHTAFNEIQSTGDATFL